MTPLLDLDALSHVLGRSPHTIKRNLRNNPSAVPPRLQLPGTKLLRWRQQDVEDWMAQFIVPRDLAEQPHRPEAAHE